MNPHLRRLGATAIMLLGTGGVFGGVIAMNAAAEMANDRDHSAVTSFNVQTRPKPPPTQKPRPKRSKPKPQKAAAAPLPNLGVAMSGVDFGLPGLDGALGEMTDALLGDVKDVVMTEDSVDSVPTLTTRTRAPYPSRARAKGIEGFVTVSMLVGADGNVSDVKVLEAEPAGVFDEAALMTVKAWQFTPATYEGRPVSIRVTQTIRFELS
ncbi:MAG: energy transducer TonB [Deltaproteobacteria bacterium]|nr:MAG: energy transducer TonB [Deltaproteobacteria bacterium]